MAVSLPDGAPNQWWAPDGRAVTGDLETRGLSCPGGGSGWARRMVFRAVNLPAGSDGLYF